MPKNVFVLCTGRCGSVTFANACRHLTNFTVGHESRVQMSGSNRVSYPVQHIEIDNRLSWFLGYLQESYGDDAHYVHLTRDRDAVARSFNRRWHMRSSIMRGYCEYICATSPKDPLDACYGYVDAVTSNIRAFLSDKPNVFCMQMEQHDDSFPKFLAWIGAEGDLDASLKEWSTRHNRSA